MGDTSTFAVLILVTAVIGLLAVLSNRLADRIHLPAPALFLVAAAAAGAVVPLAPDPPERLVERVVTIALLCILFDGGMHIGWSRFRAAAGPIAVVGVAGTFLTAAGAARSATTRSGWTGTWRVLVGTAVSPDRPGGGVLRARPARDRRPQRHDPGGRVRRQRPGRYRPDGRPDRRRRAQRRRRSGRSPASSSCRWWSGAAVGVVGGRALLWFIRRVPLPSEGLYPLRTLACALHALRRRHPGARLRVPGGVRRRHPARRRPRARTNGRSNGSTPPWPAWPRSSRSSCSASPSTSTELARPDVWVPGLVLGVVLAFVIRPVLVGLCLIPARLQPQRTALRPVRRAQGRRADPARRAPAGRDIAQTPNASTASSWSSSPSRSSSRAAWSRPSRELLRLPMRTVEPEPWALGVRLRDEPQGVAPAHRRRRLPRRRPHHRRPRRAARRHLGQLRGPRPTTPDRSTGHHPTGR